MTIFIIGGSNSIYKDGWISYFSARTREPCVNRSVGATTSLAGLYRMLLADGPSRGDCVIWEYALNEVNHINRGYDREAILKNVEHFLRLCQKKGCRVAPLIFTPRPREALPRRGEYFDKLHALFAHYGVAAFDVSTAFRTLNRVARIPDDLFADDPRYLRSPEMMDFIASGALDLVEDAVVPAEAEPIYTAGRSLALIEGFQDKVFENSLLTVPVADVPLRLTMTTSGRILAVYAICHAGFDSGVRMELHRRSGAVQKMRFSTTYKGPDGRSILKPISIERACASNRGNWAFSPGDEVGFFPAVSGGVFYNELYLKPKLENLVPPPPVISGVLTELDPR